MNGVRQRYPSQIKALLSSGARRRAQGPLACDPLGLWFWLERVLLRVC